MGCSHLEGHSDLGGQSDLGIIQIWGGGNSELGGLFRFRVLIQS